MKFALKTIAVLFYLASSHSIIHTSYQEIPPQSLPQISTQAIEDEIRYIESTMRHCKEKVSASQPSTEKTRHLFRTIGELQRVKCRYERELNRREEQSYFVSLCEQWFGSPKKEHVA